MAKDSEPSELPPLYIRERMSLPPRVTGAELAERMETTPATVSRLLNGQRKMTLEWLYAFAKALDTPIQDMFSPPAGEQKTPGTHLRSALLAYGVDRDELDQVIRVISTYVHDAASETEEQTSHEDPSQRASRLREPAP